MRTTPIGTSKMNIRRLSATGLALAFALLASAGTAASQIPAPAQSAPIALTGGTIHTVSGETIQGGTIVFDDGVITAIGASVDVPANAQRVDVSGRHVYPGLVDGFSQMGLFEIGGLSVTTDTNEMGTINPNARAEVAFNPESRHIGVARSNGILVTLSSPGGGLVSGLAAAMMLDGFTWEQMTLKPATALVVTWPSPNNEERYESQIREIRDAFAEARSYRGAYLAANGNGNGIRSDSRWEAMVPVFDGTIPVIVAADEVRQIQDAIAWAAEEDVRLIIRGGRDAWHVADQLAAQQIPVLVTSVLASPGRAWEPYDAAYALPYRLHQAGVRFAITGGSSAPYTNRLPYEAGAAVAFGLPEAEALRSVTLYPAQMLGIDDRVGSLEVGKDATLLITTGNPLEYSTQVESVYIEGRAIDLNDQHRQFFEKYHNRRR